MANILQYWIRSRRRDDPRAGDPYLESLARELRLLGGGEGARRPVRPLRRA